MFDYIFIVFFYLGVSFSTIIGCKFCNSIDHQNREVATSSSRTQAAKKEQEKLTSNLGGKNNC